MLRYTESYQPERYSFCNEKTLAMLDYYYANSNKYDIYNNYNK